MGRAAGFAASYEKVATLCVQGGQAIGSILYSQVCERRNEKGKEMEKRKEENEWDVLCVFVFEHLRRSRGTFEIFEFSKKYQLVIIAVEMLELDLPPNLVANAGLVAWLQFANS